MVTHLPITVVLDTNIWISALIFGGQLTPLLDMIENGTLHSFMSRQLLQELARVLNYPKIARALTRRNLIPEDIIRSIVECTVIVVAKPLDAIVVTADPTDDAILACAATVNVDTIISGNAHLTDLHSFHDIPIVTPRQFLQEHVDLA